MEIRPAVGDDVPVLLDLLGQLGYSPSAEAVAAGLTMPGTTVLVASDGGTPAGLLALTCRPMFHRGATVASIDSLVVDAGHRGRGVGGSLVAAAQAVAEAQGAVLIELDSNVARTDARRFYERLGFEATSNHFRRLVRPSGPRAPGPGEWSLPGGLVLRSARPADVDRLADLLATRGVPADATDARLMVADPDQGLDRTAVVVDGERVVSTVTLLGEALVLDGVTVPVGQVDLVATDPDYEGRGLVRALMAWAHRRSEAEGHLAQVMIGIPFFYRQFGYAYAIPQHRWHPLAGAVPADPSVAVRPATVEDIPAMAALQASAQQPADLRMAHRPCTWRWLVARDGSTQLVAERDGRVVATGRATPPGEDAALGELAAADPAAALALVAHAARLAPELVVQERPGTVAGDAVAPHLAMSAGKPEWYLARVHRLGPLLRCLAPVLAARLATAGIEDEHEVLLSSFRSHVRFAVGPGGMGEVHEGGPLQAPGSLGGSGVPPDALAPLVFGPEGAAGLAARLPDCYLGRQEELLAALFPPVRADLLTYYLPL